MVTIVVVDDHAVVRLGVCALLNSQPDFRVVGELGDAFSVVPEVERLHPDLLVLDLMMPGVSGLEVIRQVAKRAPATRVVVLSMHADDAYVFEALRNGARGYVLKGTKATELVDAIRTVVAGGRFLSPPLSEHAIARYSAKSRGAELDAFETLTTREREVLQLVAEGRTSPEIAQLMFISPRTVETHRGNVLRKLGLRTHSDLVRYAIRRGMLSVDD